jgi:formamidopyrimidine-DNA glycosylase
VQAIGAGAGLLSSAIPYALELEALRRIPNAVFGVLMSLEPAVAALIGQPRHLHPLLRHQADIAGIGRSWVDEILWEARLSPFKKGSELDRGEVERLRQALHVLGDAIDHYEETLPADRLLPDRAPKPLRIHKHEGEPCPRCGTTLEAVFFSEHQTTYCPEEQTGGRVLKDRRLSKLLK